LKDDMRTHFGHTFVGVLLLAASLVACPRQAMPAAVRATYQGQPGLVPACETITLNLDLNDLKLSGKSVSYSFQVEPALNGATLFQVNANQAKAIWFINISPSDTSRLTFSGKVFEEGKDPQPIPGPVVTLAGGTPIPCGSIQGNVRDGIRFSSLSSNGLNASKTSSQLFKVPDDAVFVANEAIVKLKVGSLQTTGLPGSALPGSAQAGSALPFARGIDAQTGIIHRPAKGLNALSIGGFIRADSNTGRETLAWIRSLQARSDVEYAEPNYRVTLETVPDDPLYAGVADPNDPTAILSSQRWHYEQLNLPAAWDLPLPAVSAANAVTVAVIDSGILWAPNDPLSQHPDFACTVGTGLSKILPGYDFATNDDNPFDNDDRSFHGTHVAATIGACSDNNQFGAGVSWKARILPVRAFSNINGGISSDFEKIARSVYWAAGIPLPGTLGTGNAVPPNPYPAQIINMSLGGPAIASSRFLQDAVNAATNKGVIVVVAAGNKNRDTSEFVPASLRGVIVVGATAPDKARASYSNHGGAISVMAPGGDQAQRGLIQDGVLSLGGCGGFDNFAGNPPPCPNSNPAFGSHFLQGTSMATPHVAGVIAMMLQVQPKLRNPVGNEIKRNWARVLSYLQDSSSLNGMGSCERGCGAGLLDAAKAVQKALDYPSIGPLLVPTTSSTSSENVNGAIQFGPDDTLIKFSVKNVGDATAVMNVSASSPGLSAGAFSVNVPAESEGVVVVNLNRNGVTDGSYVGRVSINYGTLTPRVLEVRASYNIGTVRPISNSQNVRVRLYKRDLKCANDQQRVNFPSFEVGNDGSFNFSNLEFGSLGVGTYDLIAYRIKPGTTPGPGDEISISELGRLDNLDFASSGTPKLVAQDITLEPTTIVIGPENPSDQRCAPKSGG
jgi:Subtilase family